MSYHTFALDLNTRPSGRRDSRSVSTMRQSPPARSQIPAARFICLGIHEPPTLPRPSARPLRPAKGSGRLDVARLWPYSLDMATTTVKSTYSLDVETVQILERIARRWRVSKSEAMRRAIRAAAGQDLPEGENTLRALDQLQRSLGLSAEAARRWHRRARSERLASSQRRERRTR